MLLTRVGLMLVVLREFVSRYERGKVGDTPCREMNVFENSFKFSIVKQLLLPRCVAV